MVRLEEIEASQPRKGLPDFRAGDTVRVEVEVVEGDKRRIQAFQGTVIQRRGAGPRQTFTVRKISSGVGVERIFPACAPGLVSVEVVHRGTVRRARLGYLRGRKGKAAQVKRRLEAAGAAREAGGAAEGEETVPVGEENGTE